MKLAYTHVSVSGNSEDCFCGSIEISGIHLKLWFEIRFNIPIPQLRRMEWPYKVIERCGHASLRIKVDGAAGCIDLTPDEFCVFLRILQKPLEDYDDKIRARSDFDNSFWGWWYTAVSSWYVLFPTASDLENGDFGAVHDYTPAEWEILTGSKFTTVGNRALHAFQ